MVSFLWLAGAIIIIGIIVPFAIDTIPNYIKKKWLTYKHPDYDRTLTSLETKFIENAQQGILTPSPDGKTKKNVTVFFMSLLF